jgi:hypothetical protein
MILSKKIKGRVVMKIFRARVAFVAVALALSPALWANNYEMRLMVDELSKFQDEVESSVPVDEAGSDPYSEMPEPNSDDWFEFFQSWGYMSSFTSLSDWETLNEAVFINSAASIPHASLGVSSIDYLSLEGSNIDSIDFLDGVVEVRRRLYLSGADIQDLRGLNDLRSIRDLYLESSQITSLNGLEKLSNISGSLYFRGNENLVDISALGNLESVGGYVYLDNHEDSTWVLPASDSAFCKGLELGTIKTNKLWVNYCDNDDPFVKLMHKLKIQPYSNESSGYENSNISLANASYDELLAAPFSVDSVGSLTLEGRSDVTSVDFLSGLVEVVRNITLINNNIVDVDGLSSLEYVGMDLKVYGNKINNVRGFSSLVTVERDLNLSYNNIVSLDGLESLRHVGRLLIRDIASLVDISAISGLESGSVYLDDREYSRFEVSAPICVAAAAGRVSFFGVSYSDVCE